MRPSQHIYCERFPCLDVHHKAFLVPDAVVKPERVSIVMISEAAPLDSGDSFYASGEALFLQTTLQAFNDAGADVHSIRDLLARGVYLTTAVKCAKTVYALKAATIETCSHLLEQEIGLFPNVRVFLLMGDVAIKALNAIARRAGVGRVVPAGPTYKIRGRPYVFRGARVFPSYLQAGPSFFIEKSKRRMIAEDIAAALALTG